MLLRLAITPLLLSSLLAMSCAARGAPDPWRITLPLVDLPHNADAVPAYPSMAQSGATTQAFYELIHAQLQDTFKDNRGATTLSIVGFDVLSSWLPLGASWMHEEWHRAVMSANGIISHNGVYDFEFTDVIKVDHVTDEQLRQLKADHPADFVRLSSAGLEAQQALNGSLERSAFFYGTPVWIQPVLLLNTLNSIGYLHTCISHQANSITQQANNDEGANVPTRDFTGLDCDAWVYDLFRPDEPYDARGTHPSGIGIDRYRDLDSLSGEEESYLRRQRNLSLLNLADPFLFGHEHFTAGDWNWNAALRHTLAPFGYVVGADGYVRGDAQRWHATLNVYSSDKLTALGADVTRHDLPITWNHVALRLTPRIALWQQPDALRFRADHAKLGGLAGLRIAGAGTKGWVPYLEMDAKSEGWVMGNVDLDRAASLRLGFEYFPAR